MDILKDTIIGGLIVPFEWIADAINLLAEGITNLFSYINPFSDNNVIKIMFMPDEGYYLEAVVEIKEQFFEKFSTIPVVMESFNSLGSYGGGSGGGTRGNDMPQFNVTMPETYGGGTFSIIDFSFYAMYRTLIHNFIRFIAIFGFIRWFIRKAPTIVY